MGREREGERDMGREREIEGISSEHLNSVFLKGAIDHRCVNNNNIYIEIHI